MTSKPNPIIQKIKLSEEQLQEIEMINKGLSVPKTTIAKNRMRNYTYEYTTRPRQLSEKQQMDKLFKIFEGKCCICANWPDYKVIYQLEGASRREFYCKKHYHDQFIKSKSK